MNLIISIFSCHVYKKKINPISIYSIVWTLVLILYETKLILYYDLSIKTWSVIIFMQLLYTLGCLIPSLIKRKTNMDIKNNRLNTKKEKRYVLKIIYILTFISGGFIILNLFKYYQMFGFNLLSQTNELYAFRLSGSEGIHKIPYVGSLVYIPLIFSAIYTIKYGFKKIFIIPMVLIILDEMTSGGRASFILAPLMVLGIILLGGFQKKISKVHIISGIAIMFIVFIVISSNRTAGVENIYSSKLLTEITNGNTLIYKLIEYVTAPVGTLNEFLKDPNFSFGQNTFMPFYGVLNKFGFDIEINIYQANYYVPMMCNVGTMLRELIEDFTIVGALFSNFVLGYVFSINYLKFREKGKYLNGIFVSVFFQIIVFSFFDWRLRAASEWIILIGGTFTAYIIDRNVRYYN